MRCTTITADLKTLTTLRGDLRTVEVIDANLATVSRFSANLCAELQGALPDGCYIVDVNGAYWIDIYGRYITADCPTKTGVFVSQFVDQFV